MMIVFFIIALKSQISILLSPQVIYVGGFLFASLLLLPFIDLWKISLSFTTVSILLLGTLIFLIVSYLTSAMLTKMRNSRKIVLKLGNLVSDEGNNCYLNQFDIAIWKYYVLIALQLVAVFLLYRHIQSIGGNGSLSQMLYNYREASVAEYDDMPFLVSAFRVLGLAIGDLSLLVLIFKINKKTLRIREGFPLLISITLAFTLALLIGARGTLIKILLCGWIEYFTIYIICNKKIPVKFIIVTIIVGAIALGSFQFAGRLLGRLASYNNLEYIGIYTSAPIVNLDYFIRTNHIEFAGGIEGTSLKTNQTLISIINYIALKLNITSLYHSQYHYNYFDYHRINGHELGNCFTTYASYIADLGYIGVFVYTAIMAVIAQIIYSYAVRGLDKIKKDRIPVSLIVYGMSFFDIFYSFFSSTFYQNVFHIGFLREMLFVWIIKVFFIKIQFKFGK